MTEIATYLLYSIALMTGLAISFILLYVAGKVFGKGIIRSFWDDLNSKKKENKDGKKRQEKEKI